MREVMTRTHIVGECPELDQWRPRRMVWKEWKGALGGRGVSKKADEEDLLGAFFYLVYEFLYAFSNPPPVIHSPFVPARYAIKFVAADIPDVFCVVSPASSVVPNSCFASATVSPVVVSAAVPTSSSVVARHCMIISA